MKGLMAAVCPTTSTRLSRRFWISLVVLGGGLAAQVAWLTSLPYSKAHLASVSGSEAAAPANPLRLGDLSWDPAPYVAAPSLEAMRTVVRRECQFTSKSSRMGNFCLHLRCFCRVTLRTRHGGPDCGKAVNGGPNSAPRSPAPPKGQRNGFRSKMLI